jgi:hypothetical protein
VIEIGESMKKVSIEELVRKAEEINLRGIKWHHHYLPPECLLSEKRKDKHVIILENQETGEILYSEDNNKMMKELERLENLFFKRVIQ